MSHILSSSGHYNGGDGDHTAGANSSSTPLPPKQLYEVFLSFRGETRRQFTDHLYKKLDNAGISVFRDKEGLPVGERNGPELLKAIEASKISIPIISPDYDSSEWCLNELVHILKCKKTYGQVVIPIFYHVKPSDLRKKFDGSEEESQVSKKRRYDYEGRHVQEWKDALEEVSYMTGLESEKIADRYEGELVEIVVAKVLKALKKHTLVVGDDLVGVGYHAEEIMNMVNVEGSSDVHAILIHGIGGIGKTTLAKVVYNELTHHFGCCSYLPNIRETSSQFKGMEGLQKQLIFDILGQKERISSVDDGVKTIRDRFKCKKVLILLDDVDHRDQINALAGKWDWFGGGSILIITSRINDILEEWEGSFNYEVNGLNDDHSFQLFCKHAFKSHSSPSEFYTIAKEIVSTTGGLPLAIEVIGCLLHGKVQDIWKEKLKKLKEIPADEVQSKLKISFDALNHEDQQIFLDIACFPSLNNEGYAIHMWDSCNFYPKSGIEKLRSLSLIKIRDSKELIIHDQLRDLGREIVRQENRDNPGKRSRLWKTEEAFEVLGLEQGTKKVKALNLSRGRRGTRYICRKSGKRYVEIEGVNLKFFESKQFKKMTELRYLRMDGVNLTGDFKNIFQHLRWLQWNLGELDIMTSNFIPKKLVALELLYLNITEQWMGWSQMKNLKVLKLEFCDELTTTPDFSTLEGLEVLILEDCENLGEIHPSIGKFSKTLKILHVRDCKKLEKLPIEVGNLEELRELLLDETSIREIPISTGFMTKLETLSAKDCLKLKSIPDSIGSLMRLQRLILSGCKLLKEIPKSIGELKLLNELNLCYTMVMQLPDSIGNLYNLESLDLFKTPIRCLPTSIGRLSKLQDLDMNLCFELESLPEPEYLQFEDDFGRRNRALNFKDMNQLRTLRISISRSSIGYVRSNNINFLLELPSNLVKLSLWHCDNLRTLPNFSNLKNLSSLCIEECPELMEINGLDGAESLKRMEIVKCRKLSKLSCMGISMLYLKLEFLNSLVNLDLSTAKKLKDLKIYICKDLVEIQGLHSAEGIERVEIERCSSLERIGSLSHLKMLTRLRFHCCDKLCEIQGIGNSVTHLELYDLYSLVSLLDLSTANKLKGLTIIRCRNLVEIKGPDNAEGIDSVIINSCNSLERFGDLSHLNMLTKLQLWDCEKLSEIRGMGASLTFLGLEDLDSLVNVPDLSTAKKLECLWIKRCRNLIEIQGLGNAEMLRSVWLCSCEKLSEIQGMGISVTDLRLEDLDSLMSLPDLSIAKKLKNLTIIGCRNLIVIQGLNNLEGIESVEINGSPLESIGTLSNLKTLTKLELYNHKKLSDVGIEELKFPDLSVLKNLKTLRIMDKIIMEIPGLQELESLERLDISGCISFQYLPDLSKFRNLKYLNFWGCKKLSEIRGLENLPFLEKLNIRGCSTLQSLPDLLNVDIQSDPVEKDILAEHGYMALPRARNRRLIEKSCHRRMASLF